MKIGLCRPQAPRYPIPDVDAAIVAKHAERVGFESLFYGEHPVRPWDDPGQSVHSRGVPYFQDLLVALARATAVTTTLTLGSGVLLLPEHNPIQLAKQLASVDLYSGGNRLVVGIGAGWSRTEITLLGGHYERRWEQVRESVHLLKALWHDERVEYRGEFYDVPPVHCFPQPATQPHPPILIGVRGSTRRALRRIVEYGDGWIPAFVTPGEMAAGAEQVETGRKQIEQLFEAAGRDPRTLHVAVIVRGDISTAQVHEYEEAGADRLLITLPNISSEETASAALEMMAERYLR